MGEPRAPGRGVFCILQKEVIEMTDDETGTTGSLLTVADSITAKEEEDV